MLKITILLYLLQACQQDNTSKQQQQQQKTKKCKCDMSF